MKLNPDCIRDILLYVEDSTDYHVSCCISPHELPSLLNTYPANVVMYHVEQCIMSNYFSRATSDLNNNITIKGLSPVGHQFIDNVRSDNIWNDVKSVSTKVGVKSLDALMKIASGVVTALIQAQIALK